jgi:hypothetical protein
VVSHFKPQKDLKSNLRRRLPGGRWGLLLCFFYVSLSAQVVWPDDAPFREETLRQLLQKNPATELPVDSVGELVPLLPKEMRENVVFVYQSRSPLRASVTPNFPRVILFTKDARFVLTFISNGRDPRSGLVESISFDDKDATFKLQSFLLPAASRSGWRPSPQAQNCTRCHGADPRPIFDSYPLWPGFYGAVEDTFPSTRIGIKEMNRFRRFRDAASQQDLFRHLLVPPGSPVSPFADPDLHRRDTLESDPESLQFAPNTRLGMALTELNRKRIYRKLAQSRGFGAHEKSLLAELLDCQSDGPRRRPLMLAIERQLAQENAALWERLGLHPEETKDHLYMMAERHLVRELAQIKSIAARAGSDMSDWSMSFTPNSLAFFDGILSGVNNGDSYYLKEDLIFEMLLHLSGREPAFRPYVAVYKAYGDLYDFGHRLELTKAKESCPLLRFGGVEGN